MQPSPEDVGTALAEVVHGFAGFPYVGEERVSYLTPGVTYRLVNTNGYEMHIEARGLEHMGIFTKLRTSTGVCVGFVPEVKWRTEGGGGKVTEFIVRLSDEMVELLKGNSPGTFKQEVSNPYPSHIFNTEVYACDDCKDLGGYFEDVREGDKYVAVYKECSACGSS